MRYRLLVADIDGTLVTSDRKITPRVLDAVRGAQRKGVRVCLATGRIWPSAQPYFQQLGADPPAILYNGGLVYDFRTDTVLRRVPLDYEEARAVLELLREFPTVQPPLYVGDRVYTGRRSQDTQRYQRKDSLKVEEVGDLVAFLPPEPMKILVIGSRSDLLKLKDRITQLPVSINAVFSEDTFLEILPGKLQRRGAGVRGAALGNPPVRDCCRRRQPQRSGDDPRGRPGRGDGQCAGGTQSARRLRDGDQRRRGPSGGHRAVHSQYKGVYLVCLVYLVFLVHHSGPARQVDQVDQED